MRTEALANLPQLRRQHPAVFRRLTWGGALAVLVVLAGIGMLALAVWRLELVPLRFIAGLGQLGHFITLMFPPDPGPHLNLILRGIGETLAIAFLGTLGAAIIALPVALMSARNTTIHWLMRFASRRVLDGIRGIDALIWALIWVSVVGLGPFAGVLAILVSDIGTFGKVFSEALENADQKPQEGILSAGGNGLARIRLGILPQVLPVMAGQVLYFFESNVRSSAIIGIVGAGGIGLHLTEMIRTLEWQAVSFIILLILVLVAVIDVISGRLRAAMAG